MDGFATQLRLALEALDDAGLALMLVRPTVAADAVRDGLTRAKGALRDELGAYLAAWETTGRAGGTDVERRFLLKLAGLLPSATLLPGSAERLSAGLSRPGPLDAGLLDAVVAISEAYAGAYYVAPPQELLVLVQPRPDLPPDRCVRHSHPPPSGACAAQRRGRLRRMAVAGCRSAGRRSLVPHVGQ